MSALTMITMGALTGRPGYISDPVIDTSKNQIIYAHCVASNRAFGPDGARAILTIEDGDCFGLPLVVLGGVEAEKAVRLRER